jgi:hypothetical protein
MKNKRILEQENQDSRYFDFVNADKERKTPTTGTDVDLRQAYKVGCFNYPWLTLDPAPQPKTITGNKLAITGKNENKEQIFIYANGVAKNNVTGNTLRWSCPKLAEQTSSILSNFGVTKDDDEKVQGYTDELKAYLDLGSISEVFDQWNKMLSANFPTIGRLNVKPENKKTWDVSNLNANYTQAPGLDRQFPGWKNIVIWVPNDKLNITTVQKKTDLTVGECITKLTNYVVSAIQANAGITPILDITQVLRYQTDLQRCWANNAYSNFPGITEEQVSKLTKELSPFGFFKMGKKLSFENIKKILRGETKYLKPGAANGASSYIFTIDRRAQRESKFDNLDLLIKENLMITLSEKKKKRLTENKIITNRTNVLLEGGIPKTKVRQERLINNIIIEAISLNSQGLDKDLIKENFWDTIKGLLGSHSERDLVEMFKEKYKTFIIEKLTNEKPDTWVSEIVNTSFETIPTSNYFNGKAFECDYITNVISKTLTQEMIKKTEKSFDDNTNADTVLDVVKKSVVNLIDDQTFMKNIEHGIAKFICPAIQGIPDKLDKAAEQMRDKALKP